MAEKPRRKGLPPSLGAIDRHQWLQRHAAMVDGMRKSFSVAPLDVYPPGGTGRLRRVTMQVLVISLTRRSFIPLVVALHGLSVVCGVDAGTWEHAAGKVFWDAHYQHALLLLSTALSTKDVDVGVSRVRCVWV